MQKQAVIPELKAFLNCQFTQETLTLLFSILCIPTKNQSIHIAFGLTSPR